MTIQDVVKKLETLGYDSTIMDGNYGRKYVHLSVSDPAGDEEETADGELERIKAVLDANWTASFDGDSDGFGDDATSDIRIEPVEFPYVVRTDASTQEIDAVSIDEAAKLFADDEFPGNLIVDVADLFRHVELIGDGAWCWIESTTAPDGKRQSVGC